jgi:D-lactate dehydrogenase
MSTPGVSAAFFDTKPYDLRYFQAASTPERIQWRFHEFRLGMETVAAAEGVRVVCLFVNDRADQGCVEALTRLGVQLIAMRCAGFNNVDLTAARRCGVEVVRVPAYSPHAVAEHAVGLLLTLNRRIHRAYNRVREHNFSLNGLVGFDLAGKTVGIVGTGKIGRVAAKAFHGFEMDVVAYDPMPDRAWAEKTDVTYVTWDDLLKRSDIVSLHLPLTKETHHLLNAAAFNQMKPGVYLVNTSRGKLIDTRALIDALKDGRVGGIALDVYEEEEGIFFEDHSNEVLLDDVLTRLLAFPNVLITSHQAFLTHEALTEIARVTTENILRLDSKEPWLPGTCLTQP